jgi:transposase InsO family protein
MKDHQHEFSVRRMSKALAVSTAGFYKYINATPSKREDENSRLLLLIKSVYKESKQTYGYPRVYEELISQGVSCSLNRVAKIMHDNQILSKMTRKFKPKHKNEANKITTPNILNQAFEAESPNQKWVGDITYIPTREGWLYLAVVLDLFSRKIIGMSMDKNMAKELVISAINQAILLRGTISGLIFHSDKGSQYTSHDFQDFLVANGIQSSMSAKGSCYDNACAESFFHTLKTEQTSFVRYETREEAKQDIFDYVMTFYNRKRRHSYLGYLSPENFEAIHGVRN